MFFLTHAVERSGNDCHLLLQPRNHVIIIIIIILFAQ